MPKLRVLPSWSLLVGHVGFGNTQHPGGSADVQVDVVLEGVQEGGVSHKPTPPLKIIRRSPTSYASASAGMGFAVTSNC